MFCNFKNFDISVCFRLHIQYVIDTAKAVFHFPVILDFIQATKRSKLVILFRNKLYLHLSFVG